MATAKKTQIKPAQSEEPRQLPALAGMYEEDAGGGFEQADRESFAIPFLIILQSGSPQVKKSEGEYIKGAAEGMLYNTVTQELFDGDVGLYVVPCYYRRTILEWGDRKAGAKGFFGQHDPLSSLYVNASRDDEGRVIDGASGHVLADTREHYVIVVHPTSGLHLPAVVSMGATQIKKSKNWMSKMDGIKLPGSNGKQFTPPMFSHIYRLTTVPESNDKGAWMGWRIELDGQVTDPALYATAKAFHDAVKRGEAKAKHEDDPNGMTPEEF